jgi:hypothetical protein
MLVIGGIIHLITLMYVQINVKLEKLVKDGTWIDHKPPAIFKKKSIGAVTDKQFTASL